MNPFAAFRTWLNQPVLDQIAIVMKTIQEFAAAQQTYNDQMDTHVSGIAEDVKNLNDQIAKLQSTPGALSQEDQNLLDSIQARSKAIADKLSAVDQITPPVVPSNTITPPTV